MNENLGEIIKKARQDKGLEQKELSRLLKKTPSTLSQIETGQLIPGEELLKKICSLLKKDYGLLGRMANYEKARTSLQKEAAEENLKQYKLSRKIALSAFANESGKYQFPKVGEYNAFPSEISKIQEKEPFIILPNLSSQEKSQLTWVAFQESWLLEHGGTLKDKKIFFVSNQAMFPVIAKGDFVLIDKSPLGLQIKPGKIYAINGNNGIMLRRIYFGKNSDTLILASENKNDYPDEELTINNKWPINPMIIGQVFWVSRLL